MNCCAVGCEHKSYHINSCHFYNFPTPNDGPDWEKWYNIWVTRINRVNPDGSQWRPEAANTKLCSCHFRLEDQWDPKSRKRGLRCKEPVFFQYNLLLKSVLIAASPPTQDASYKEGDVVGFVANLTNAPVDNTATCKKEASRKVRKVKKSKRPASFKIRDYFEERERTKIRDTCTIRPIPTTRISLNEDVESIRKQEYFTSIMSIVDSANEQDRHITLNTSCEQQGTQQVNVRNLQDSDPCVIDDEVIEISESDENVQDNLSVQQGCLKHEQLDSCHEFLHTEPTVQAPETTSGVCVKSELYRSSLSDESLLDYHGEVKQTPRIISSHSAETHDGSQDHYNELHSSGVWVESRRGQRRLVPWEVLLRGPGRLKSKKEKKEKKKKEKKEKKTKKEKKEKKKKKEKKEKRKKEKKKRNKKKKKKEETKEKKHTERKEKKRKRKKEKKERKKKLKEKLCRPTVEVKAEVIENLIQ